MTKCISVFCIACLIFISCKKGNNVNNEQKQTEETDLPLILGRWDSDVGEFWSWWFAPPDIVSAGFKGTDRGWYGKWELTDNILTITESNEFEHEEYGEELWTEVTIIKLEIIDIDNIILHYEKGGQEKLTRSNE